MKEIKATNKYEMFKKLEGNRMYKYLSEAGELEEIKEKIER